MTIEPDAFLDVLFLRIRGEVIKFASTLKMKQLNAEKNLIADIKALESVPQPNCVNSGKLNFLGAQITLGSQLNSDRWNDLLQGYWDTQLPLLVRYGFSLDFNRFLNLEAHTENLSSAKNDVQAYLEEEVNFGAIQGPFEVPPKAAFTPLL